MSCSCIVSTPLQPVCLQTVSRDIQQWEREPEKQFADFPAVWDRAANFLPLLCLDYELVSLSDLSLATSSHVSTAAASCKAQVLVSQKEAVHPKDCSNLTTVGVACRFQFYCVIRYPKLSTRPRGWSTSWRASLELCPCFCCRPDFLQVSPPSPTTSSFSVEEKQRLEW